jgi:bifunctional DNase/RNase
LIFVRTSRQGKWWTSACIALGVLAFAACAAASSETLDAPDGFVPVELTTVGLDPATDSPVVLLRDPESGKVLPIWVGLPEAQAIARTLHGIVMDRPMTHDLFSGVIRRLGASVQEVRVHDLRDDVYHGVILLQPRDRPAAVEVDARPSDALALALRTGAPIFVARPLLEAAPDVDFIAPDAAEQVVQTLGLVVVAPSASLQEEFELPDRRGVVVSRAFGEARDAGLERGDLIVEANGVNPTTPMEFFEAVRGALPGEPVELRYWRKGREHTLTLYPRPLDPGARRPRAGART